MKHLRRKHSILIVGLALMFVLAACQTTPEFKGTPLTEPRPAADFTLTTGDEPVSLADFEDEVRLLYFGYTFCPDVCPTTMSDLARVQAELDDTGEQMQVLMISVDPQRDTPEVAERYAASFHPDFIGLSGSPEEIATVADAWGIFYEANDGSSEESYTVDHTSRVFVVDREGRYRLSFPFGMAREDMISDLEILLGE